MNQKYLIAKTFKKKGTAAIPLVAVPDFFTYVPELEALFKRNVEFLIISANDDKSLDESWPEYAPFEEVKTKDAFEKVTHEKSTR